MNSEAALKQEIRNTAEAKANELLADARKKAEAILSEAEKEEKKIRERKELDATKRLEQTERFEVAKARMECTRLKLTLLSKYLEGAFEEALSVVNNLPKKDPSLYARTLANYIAQALENLGDSNPIAVSREADRELVGNILKELEARGYPHIPISLESLNCSGGILIHGENMRVYYVNTFESRFLKLEENLRAKVATALLRK